MRLTQHHIMLFFLLLVILASGADIAADLSAGASTSHLVQESVILTFAVLSLIWIVRTLSFNKKELHRLYREMADIKSPRANQPYELIESRKRLSDAISIQFKTWELSRSEQEVGMLLLKGLSLKEIGLLRGTAEKTIRQQASAIYKKAGVPGRHAFSAWFIEDFL